MDVGRARTGRRKSQRSEPVQNRVGLGSGPDDVSMTSSGRVSMTSSGSGQNLCLALTGSGQKSGSGVDRVRSKNRVGY